MITRLLRHDRRAVAAVEFTLVAPVLLSFIGGMADFGLALAAKGKLIHAVAQGAQYAYLNPATTSTNIIAVVKNASYLTGVTATVPKLGYYCIGGTTAAPTLVASSSGATCAGDSTTAGYFAQIQANYTYTPIMPFYSLLATTTFTQTITTRLS